MARGKVAFDLDQTIYAHPNFLLAVWDGLREAGYKVGILTENPDGENVNLKKLNDLGYKHISFYYGLKPGEKHLPPLPWKTEQCRKHGIEHLIDDLGSGFMHIMTPKEINDQ